MDDKDREYMKCKISEGMTLAARYLDNEERLVELRAREVKIHNEVKELCKDTMGRLLTLAEGHRPYQVPEIVIEELAALEHDQWMYWAKDIIDKEAITTPRSERWQTLFVPYAELSEEMKEHDRKWARKVLEIIKSGPEDPRVEALWQLLDDIDSLSDLQKDGKFPEYYSTVNTYLDKRWEIWTPADGSEDPPEGEQPKDPDTIQDPEDP